MFVKVRAREDMLQKSQFRCISMAYRKNMKQILCFFALMLSSGISCAQAQPVRHCVVLEGKLMEVDASYNTTTGAYTINNGGRERALEEVYVLSGAAYAAGTKWYMNNEEIKVLGRQYVKYGLLRVLAITDIAPVTG